MRIYLANVGANSGHRGLFSPLFADGRFEFIPIPAHDEREDRQPRIIRYRDLQSHNNPDEDLRQFVPEKFWNTPCHNDPEFQTRTYGDGGDNPRSVALTTMETGDALLFLARLEEWQAGRRTGPYGFFLIGGLLAEFAGWIRQRSPHKDRFANNAHQYRGDAMFWGVAGSGQSRRFEFAVPINREICDRVFRDAKGNPWRWDKNTELGTISSYTRACRCVLDTGAPDQRERSELLHAWIARHSGAAAAELLASVA